MRRAPVPRLCTLVKFLTRWQINAGWTTQPLLPSVQPYRKLNFAQGLFVSISYPRSEKVEEIIVIECNMGNFRNPILLHPILTPCICQKTDKENI